MSNSNNAQDNIDNVKDNTKELAENLKDDAKDVGNKVKEQLKASGKDALDTADGVKDDLLEWVKSNPVKSIGIAFFAGWLFS